MKRFPFIHTTPKIPVDRTVELVSAVGVSGYVIVELLNRDGSVKQRLEFKNLITDVGLDMIMGRGGNLSLDSLTEANIMYAGVGTGSTAAASTDTTLVTEITPTTTHRTNSDGSYAQSGPTYVAGSPDYWWRQSTFLFDFTQANGNLTEVGLFDANSSGNMFMRQLLKDSGGTPTTIVKTSAEQLRLIYEIRIEPLQSDNVQSAVAISATNYDITTRAANANAAGAWGSIDYASWGTGSTRGWALETNTLGARTTVPSGTATGSNSRSVASYTNGTFYRDITYVWNAATANFATGIGSVIHGLKSSTLTSTQMFQTAFNPQFAKDNTKQLNLIIRYTVDRA